ncbi:MAG: tetratricopeptide repeat protein, partial [Myxococcales bacterium]|nr:tetratricopeptide repeat protein [Myxococcales bacterium]
ERPFPGDLRGVVMAKHEGPPPAPRGGKVPRAIQEALRRGLAVEAASRWPSMEELLAALRHDPASGRRRWWWAGGVATVGATLVASSMLMGAEHGSPCEGAREQLRGVWDDEARASVRAALEGTALSYAHTTWERVEGHLDDYADAWARQHQEACEATAIRRVQSEALLDRRMQCLRRRKLRLGAAVEVLRHADAELAETAIQQVTSLPPLERCADVDALMAEVPPPEHPGVATAVEEIRDELTTAEALAKAGRYDEAQTSVEALLERARPLEHDPLEAELLALSASLADHQGRFELAEARGTRSFELALRSGATTIAGEAALTLMYVTGSQQARPEIGRVWGASAKALAERSDPDGSQQAMVLNAMGVIAYREGDFAGATERFEQALPGLVEAVGENHDRVAVTLNHLGAMLDEQGRYTEAEPHFRRALAIQIAVFGEGHPRTTMSMDNLALCLQAQGRNEEAKALHERTLALRERALGPTHPDTAIAHNNLGWDLMGLHQPQAAAEHFARGLESFEAALGPEHPRVAMAAESLALAELERGRLTESEALHRRALEIRRAALGPDHPNVALSLTGLGRVAREQGRLEEAIELQRQALAIIEAKAEGAERYLADVLMGLGASLLAAERFAEARPVLERALALREGGGVDPIVLAQIRFDLARAIAGEGGEPTRARELALVARDGLREAEGEASREPLAEIEAWLAHAIETHESKTGEAG